MNSFEEIGYGKRMKFENFQNIIQKEYKELKKVTYACQSFCYAQEKSSLDTCKDCSQKCLKPHKFVKRIIDNKIENCEVNFKANEINCTNSNQPLKNKDCLYDALNEYENCLNEAAPQLKISLSAYVNNFESMMKDFNKKKAWLGEVLYL